MIIYFLLIIIILILIYNYKENFKELRTNGNHIVLGFHGHHHIAESNSLIGNKQKLKEKGFF